MSRVELNLNIFKLSSFINELNPSLTYLINEYKINFKSDLFINELNPI